MREAEVPVVFQPMNKRVHVLRGTRLLEAAAGADVVLDQPCGGAGTCGKCRVRLTGELCAPTPAEQQRLSEDELEQGIRLACQTTVCGPITVEVPQTSLLGARYQILSTAGSHGEIAVDPPVRKRYVELPGPQRGDDAPDMVRLQRELGPFRADIGVARELPERLRENDFRVTAVMADGRLLAVEPGNTETEQFAVALDLGTTTMVASLLDVTTGAERAVTSRLNPQTRFGDDVLSRIVHATENPDGLRELAHSVVGAADEMIGELVAHLGIHRDRVYEVAVAGNTTMQQLFCRIDPRPLGQVPFVPATGPGLWVRAEELGLHIHPRGRAYVLPVIGGFVGGDTTAGILATGMAEASGPTLLVDIGTNGEIVLKTDGQMLAASTAAGPAFEGARIEHGMRGSTGAIEKIVVEPCERGACMRMNVIGGVLPTGLCGSALIDAAAELLRHGVLNQRGKLLMGDELDGRVPPDLRDRLRLHEGKPAFCLADEQISGTGKPILLTQRDLRELQLATGAIRAGVSMLLKTAGVRPDQLEAVLIAGGFGNFIRRKNAQRIGLMPHEVDRGRIRYQGNTSLAGARAVALSRKVRAAGEEIARRIEHVDLSTNLEFQTAFADAMLFPDNT